MVYVESKGGYWVVKHTITSYKYKLYKISLVAHVGWVACRDLVRLHPAHRTETNNFPIIPPVVILPAVMLLIALTVYTLYFCHHQHELISILGSLKLGPVQTTRKQNCFSFTGAQKARESTATLKKASSFFWCPNTFNSCRPSVQKFNMTDGNFSAKNFVSRGNIQNRIATVICTQL